jgi:UPF0176 protein
MENEQYLILLYYCYATIEDPEAYREEHHLFCIENNIRGRIIVSSEGLNGTVSGLKEDCEKYMAYVRSDERFADTEFKIDTHNAHAFAKINVRAKEEIVHSGLRHLNPREKTGKHLDPAAFKALKDDEDVVILDVRSDYEHKLGHFKNALRLDIENFRDFPEKVTELEHLKDKKILTYCTGGIKCEKASAFLLEQGFKDVYQLHGGIIKYGLEAGGEDFEGKCLLCVVDDLMLEIGNLMIQKRRAEKREWVGLAVNEAREFYESNLSRADLINKIDEFLEEKNA